MYDAASFVEDINQRVEQFVQDKATAVSAEALGLDRRAGYSLYVTDDAVIVSKHDDRTLQYYGGFEYVDKDYRQELGDYVFYLRDDERVADHLDTYFEREDAE